jgi:hypothetical protein
MQRIFHHYEKWEDHKCGFYNSYPTNQKEELIQKVIDMFNDEQSTTLYMNRVIGEWKFSCEHNLSNDSLNKIAYIGQGACCLYGNVPSDVTKEAWGRLSEEVQNRSNNIAKEVLNKWLENYK